MEKRIRRLIDAAKIQMARDNFEEARRCYERAFALFSEWDKMPTMKERVGK